MAQTLLNIDAVRCGIIFGTLYQQHVYEISNQIETSQRYLFFKGAM